ncbi:hypothetical protein ACFVX6_03700 [Streptomyces sp. NPDC058289]|uniref:hypothetical protein n=1 Tax=Streptomyces sp. NPDC058289 TaxID=3346425 RepID=UPI0036E2EFF5
MYLAQTPAAAFRQWAAGLPAEPGTERFRSVLLDVDDPLTVVGERTREEFVTDGAGWALRHHNIPTLDGWWCEAGDEPLHGACDDPATCPHDPPPTRRPGGTAAYLAGLPDDALLVYLRCHI